MLKAITEACRALAAYLKLRALQVEQETEADKERQNEIKKTLRGIDKAVDAGDTTRVSLLAHKLSTLRGHR